MLFIFMKLLKDYGLINYTNYKNEFLKKVIPL